MVAGVAVLVVVAAWLRDGVGERVVLWGARLLAAALVAAAVALVVGGVLAV
jgi:hypothetical protein